MSDRQKLPEAMTPRAENEREPMRNCMELLRAKWAEGKYVCVGLDSDQRKIPAIHEIDVLRFNKHIVRSTADLVCAYKPNIAFYANRGEDGICDLKATIEMIKEEAPDVPIILDAKRADIGNTNEGYAAEVFDYFGADAVTVNPYFGKEALRPFLNRKDKGIIVLCRTSNPGAGEFQDLLVDGTPLYRTVATAVAMSWNDNGNCALVVGATAPSELESVRNLVDPNIPLLIPGIGKQGGDIEATVRAAKRNMIINSSSGIIFASSGPDFADRAREETEKLHSNITAILRAIADETTVEKGAVTT